jgi:arylsulfatase A-like enzyme
MRQRLLTLYLSSALIAVSAPAAYAQTPGNQAPAKRPNVVVLMTDDVGWNDFGAYSGGGAALGHPTPNVDRLASEGAMFTSWYGQASCTAGRASFITGSIPIRSALSVVVAPGDMNFLRKETPTIAEFFRDNGYSTYFSGKWHLGDKPEAYPIEHGFDEMKVFAAYYPAVYVYSNTSNEFHPWFPSYNKPYLEEYNKIVNLYEWEGVTGQPAKKVAEINWDYLATFDVRQADYAVEYIKEHAADDKPFFMDVNFMKMHNPNNPAPQFKGKTHLGHYSDAVLELDDNIGRIMETIREVAPNTIVIVTADNGAWQDGYPDAGTHPFRGDKGSTFEAGWRVPGLMWWPGHIPAGAKRGEMMTHIDLWSTLSSMVGITPPPHGEWKDDNGKPIYFDSIDNSAYILGTAQHSARRSWVYIDGENFGAVRVDMAGDEKEPWINIAWKYSWTAKDTWLGAQQNLGGIGSIYNLTMDPFEKYDMTFPAAMSSRLPKTSPGAWTGQDNAWVLSLVYPALIEFDQSIMKYPSLMRFPGGASDDLLPNLQNPGSPVPALDPKNLPQVKAGGG